MAKPNIVRLKPQDSSKNFVVSMTYSGTLPYSNRIIIYDATTLSVLYDNTTENLNYSIKQVIPANTLINGKKYAVQGQVFDINGNASALSDKVYFWCLATPSFYFKDINDGKIFDPASNFDNLGDEQSDWEDIGEYRFYLYDETKQSLIESEAFYGTDHLTYAYRGLSDDKFYYIRAIGTTVNGIELDTGYIKIFVNYENPEDYKLIYAECNEKNSIVTYQTNFVVINPSDTTTQYEYENGWINLLGKTLAYDKDFEFSGDFTLSIRMKDVYRTTTVLKCSNGSTGFSLLSYVYDDSSMRYKLVVPNALSNYILYSEPIYPDYSDIVTVHIRRTNNVYELYCFVEFGGTNDPQNMWFGEKQPSLSQVDSYDIWINMDGENTVRIDKNDVNIFYQKDEPILLVEKDYDIWIGGDE